MQKPIVNSMVFAGFDGQLEKAWQIIKHKAHQKNLRPNVRFSAEVLPAYYQSEVSQVFCDSGSEYTLKTSIPALSGNQGVMPRAMFSQTLRASFENGDEAPIDFFDTFNNRYYRLYCETEQKYDLTYQLEEEQFHWNHHRQPITDMMASLAGQTGASSAIPKDHLVQYTGLLGLKLTCTHALTDILSDYFQAEFSVEHSGLEYLPLTPCSLTRLGERGNNQQLGMGALVGKTTPMIGQKLIIKIAPQNYDHYLKIRHDNKMIKAIDHLVRSYMGVNTKYSLYMKVNSQYLPQVRLSGNSNRALRLGQSVWMNNQSNSRQFVEMPLTIN